MLRSFLHSEMDRIQLNFLIIVRYHPSLLHCKNIIFVRQINEGEILEIVLYLNEHRFNSEVFINIK